MGEILCSRRYDRGADKVVVELLLHQEEYRQLRGEMDNIYVFSENVANIPSKVSLRGRNDATKYFLIPRQLRKALTIRGMVSCQRLEHCGKVVFVYVLDPCNAFKRGSKLAM